MSKEQSDINQPEYTPEDLLDPLGWMKRQHYGTLKYWLRQAVWNNKFLPVMIPPYNVPPMLHLVQLLLRSDVEVRTAMRTIVPDLLREWNVHDTRDCLLSLLLLCSNLSCNEAEATIGTIITEKLRDAPEDIKCRKEALGVLQTIGTNRTLHLFRRYLSDPEYAAYCYRGLYLLDLSWAATELPTLMKVFRGQEGRRKLGVILHFLFIATLKPPQYMTVVQSFVEDAPGSYFVRFFEILRSIGVFGESFFNNLSPVEHTKLLSQLIKRTSLEHSTAMVELLRVAGIEIEPPANSYNPEPEPADPATFPPVPIIGGGTHFTYRHISKGNRLPLVPKEELSEQRQWEFAKGYNPLDLDHLFTNQGFELMH